MHTIRYHTEHLHDGTYRVQALFGEKFIASCRDMNEAYARREVEDRADYWLASRPKPELPDDTTHNSAYWAEVLRRNPGKLCQGKPLNWNKFYAWLCWVPWEYVGLAAFIIGIIGYVYWE